MTNRNIHYILSVAEEAVKSEMLSERKTRSLFRLAELYSNKMKEMCDGEGHFSIIFAYIGGRMGIFNNVRDIMKEVDNGTN